MFFTYLRRELRRRRRQAIIISVGLALGIGLVITVTAASAGVKAAQGTVLQNLYGVGTRDGDQGAHGRIVYPRIRGPPVRFQAGQHRQDRPADRRPQPRQPRRR